MASFFILIILPGKIRYEWIITRRGELCNRRVFLELTERGKGGTMAVSKNWEAIMKKKLPKSKMIRYCLSDIAKGLFNGILGLE